jgi:hypothetical protein
MVPPVLYIPVQDFQPESDNLTIDFRKLPDGRVALLAYTALDRLTAGCGTAQPWALVSTAKLDEIDRNTPYDVIMLDVQIEEDQQRKGGVQ